jgi:hypothetical protein
MTYAACHVRIATTHNYMCLIWYTKRRIEARRSHRLQYPKPGIIVLVLSEMYVLIVLGDM